MSTYPCVAVIGATGAVGSACLEQLLADPQIAQIRVFARRPSARPDERLDWRVVDFDALPEAADMSGVETLYCCLGTTMKVAGSKAAFRKVDHDYVLAAGRAALNGGVKQMLVVSAVGADAGSGVFYNRVKGETEKALQALGLPSLHILRPSLLLGPRAEQRPGESLGKAIAPLLSPLLCGPLKKYRPIQTSAVAAAMLQLARRAQTGTHIHHLPLDS